MKDGLDGLDGMPIRGAETDAADVKQLLRKTFAKKDHKIATERSRTHTQPKLRIFKRH